MGNRTVGAPPRVEPVREACLEVLDHKRRLIDHVCAPAAVFVDDLFTYGEGAGTFESVVIDEFAQPVATSRITFDARWTRDPMQGCRAMDGPSPVDLPVGYNSYSSAPVFPGLEVEAETECLADVTFSISSEYLGAATGAPQGMLGVYAGEEWRGPKQDL